MKTQDALPKKGLSVFLSSYGLACTGAQPHSKRYDETMHGKPSSLMLHISLTNKAKIQKYKTI
eukprot:4500922-Amphidinium_carterae.1